MRYLKTEDWIYEIEQTLASGMKFHADCMYDYEGNLVYDIDDASTYVKQADTIQELCDYVFYIEDGRQKMFKFPDECNFEFIKDLFLRGWVKDLKFAILTDKGIIFVAEMKEEGDLRLL